MSVWQMAYSGLIMKMSTRRFAVFDCCQLNYAQLAVLLRAIFQMKIWSEEIWLPLEAFSAACPDDLTHSGHSRLSVISSKFRQIGLDDCRLWAGWNFFHCFQSPFHTTNSLLSDLTKKNRFCTERFFQLLANVSV